ncbi:sodium:proton antiporter [Marinihelvus fidelis]|uniref:Sodium:proton antiporter n=1 Tax=Marinihelvus fidelis TaxID=2613842 RepID=A0A5N0TL41_9GAMM|nr:cation:proton antiporter [Marinihelvus fidelis]KAA9134029.1 sodium:proton antiporter [Marinihelvus fidelis]
MELHEQLAVIALFVFAYSLVAKRVEQSWVSGPMVFVTAGFLMGPAALGWFSGEESRHTLRFLADLTLALFLFNDSANANLRTLKRYYGLPARMLLIGLPGAVLLGFLAAFVMFDALSLYEAAALGAMLAATDAALGKAVVTNPAVPSRLREGLNVESGLNDGLCVPILLLFVGLEVGSEAHAGGGAVLHLLAEELGIGTLVGVSLAAVGVWLFRTCWDRGWMSSVWGQITSAALAIGCFSVAQSLGGSGYIAAFVGGMLFGHLAGEETHEVLHSSEGMAETLALLTWMLFGMAVVWQVIGQVTWEVFVYALLSLTVVRMLPVWLSLAGTGESNANKLFLGWFGPRGLASIVFAVMVLDAGLPGAELMNLVVLCTVFLSLVAHGMTANPLARRISASRQGS